MRVRASRPLHEQRLICINLRWFFTPNIAVELILATQRHTVTHSGANVGTVKHLPPMLLLQYHFMPGQNSKPYVGAGLPARSCPA